MKQYPMWPLPLSLRAQVLVLHPLLPLVVEHSAADVRVPHETCEVDDAEHAVPVHVRLIQGDLCMQAGRQASSRQQAASAITSAMAQERKVAVPRGHTGGSVVCEEGW